LNFSICISTYWARTEKESKEPHTHTIMTDNTCTNNHMDTDVDVDESDMDYSQDIHAHDNDSECPVCDEIGCCRPSCEEEIERAEYMAQYWADF